MTLWVLVIVVIVAALGFLTMSLRGDPAEVAGDSHAQAVKARYARKSSQPPAAASVSSTTGVPLSQESQGQSAGAQIGPASSTAESIVPALDPNAPANAFPGGGAAQDGTAAAGTAPPPPPTHLLRLRIAEFTRVTVECAGQVSLDQELYPGSSRTLECTEPVVLSAGNGGAVEYAVDGGPPATLGAAGQQVEGLVVAPPPEPPAPATGAAEQRKDPDERH